MSVATPVLKAPFPWFGGKRRVAELVWSRLGDCDNVIEPFAGSAAFLLARPHPPRVETLNDADCMVANFWRATGKDPEAVARAADWPVNEADMHARHRWLVLSDEAKAFRQRMRTEPDYFDAKIAGWWCHGLCMWIGGGWCTERMAESQQPPAAPMQNGGKTGGNSRGLAERPEGWEQVPRAMGGKNGSPGVHGKAFSRMENQMPLVGHRGKGVSSGNRPQLADAYDIGRGVNSNGDLGTCEARLAWLTEWFGRLRDRLRLVRVCCGDWLRVCGSDSVTVRLGLTGIFFDPPYSAEAGRDMNLYGVESGDVAHAVRAYCLERGGDPRYRIALCGYAGEGHDELERAGWDVVEWKAQGGYGNRSAKGKENAAKERIWFSPHALKPDAGANLFEGYE